MALQDTDLLPLYRVTDSTNRKISVAALLSGTSSLWKEDGNSITPKKTGADLVIEGNVGIGTDSPGTSLHVSGTPQNLAYFDNNKTACLVTFSDAGTTNNSQVKIGSVGDDLRLDAGGSERMHIDSAGNVGIGTDSPDRLVHVKGADTTGFTGIQVQNSNGNTGIAGVEFSSDPTHTKAAIGLVRQNANGRGSIVFYNNQSNDATNWSASDEVMRISNTGNVGIGTDSPAQKLHVNGILQVDNQIRAWSSSETCRIKSQRTTGDVFTVWNNATSVNDGTKIATISANGNATFNGTVRATVFDLDSLPVLP